MAKALTPLDAYNNPEAFLNQLPGLQFVQVNKRRFAYPNKDSGLILFEKKSNWCIVNHSDRTDIPSGNIYTFTSRLHNTTDPVEIFSILNKAIGRTNDPFFNAIQRNRTTTHTRNIKQYAPTFKVHHTTANSLPDNDLFTMVRTFAKGNDPDGVIKTVDLDGLQYILNHTPRTTKDQQPAILKGIFEGGTSGEYCRKSSGMLFFDIDVKAAKGDKPGENEALLKEDARTKVFKALKAVAPLVWSSWSGKGIAGVFYVPGLDQYDHHQTDNHLEAAKAVYQYIGEMVFNQTGIKITFDPAQGKFRQIRFLTPQVEPVKINHNCAAFHFKQVLSDAPTSQGNDTVFTFNDYVSEKTPQIIDVLTDQDKVILKSLTGSGKTWFVLDLIKRGTIAGCNKVIFAVPTNTLAQQVASDYRINFGVTIPIVNENFTWYDDSINAYIATYDSVQKLKHLLPEALLIVDEAHLLFDAGGYRLEACNDVYYFLGKAARSLIISATPYKLDGWHYLDCKHEDPDKAQKLIVSPIKYNGKAIDLPIPPAAEGLVLIRVNDTASLEALKTKIGDAAAIISSKYGTKYKEDCPVYNSLINTGKVPPGIKYILTTSLLDTGVSIRQQVDQIILFSPLTVNEVLQFGARARKLKGVNHSVKVTVYIKNKTECTSKAYEVDFNGIVEHIKKSYEKEKQAFNLLVQARTEAGRPHRAEDLHKDIKNNGSPIYWNKHEQKFEISEPQVHHIALMEWKSKVSDAGFFAALEASGDHVVVEPFQVVDFSECKQLAEVRKEKAQITKDAKKQAFDIFHQDSDIVMKAAAKYGRNKRLKAEIMKCYLPDIHSDKDITNFYLDHKALFDHHFFNTPIKRFLQLIELHLDKDDSLQVVYANQTKQKFDLIYNRIILTHKPDSPKIDKHLERIERLDATIQGAEKYEFTIREMKILLINSGYSYYSVSNKQQIILRFKEVFEGSWNARKKTFEIRQRWTKKNLEHLFKKRWSNSLTFT